jgi:hypothetical protein
VHSKIEGFVRVDVVGLENEEGGIGIEGGREGREEGGRMV